MHFGGQCNCGDDEVVASYGVYLSPSLAGQTHVFQYPLRNRDRPYETNRVSLFCTDGGHGSSPKEAAIIHSSSRLTMRCTLDTFGSPNFSPGENKNSDNSEYSYTLHSEPFAPRSDYCVAYFVGDELHLTPVSTVQQMYPAPDSEVVEESNGEAHLRTQADGPLRVSERHSSAQAPTSVAGSSLADRFQRELNRQRSTVLNQDAESAKELEFFPISSAESKSVKQRLVSTTREPVTGTTSATRAKETPESSLFPPEILVSGGITGGTDKTAKIIRSFASRYSLAEQVAYLMLRCQVLSLSVLADHLVAAGGSPGPSPAVPPSDIVAALRPRAVYMHGVWVCRSCPEFKGTAAALREVILLSFFQSSDATVPRSELNGLVSSATLRRSIKDILETLAVLNADEPDPTKRKWRLCYVPDAPDEYQKSISAFKADFAAEEAAQHAAWEKRSRTILSHLGYINVSRIPPKLTLETAQISGPSSAGTSAGVGGAGGGMLPSASSRTGGMPATDIREQDLAPIKHFIRALFSEHGVLNKMRAKELVLKGREEHYPKATNQMLSAALQSSVQQFTEATWVLTSLGEPNVDKFRPFILHAAQEMKQFETSALHRRVEEIVSERLGPAASTGNSPSGVPDAVLKRVVKEVAEFKAGERLWHLKNGNAAAD